MRQNGGYYLAPFFCIERIKNRAYGLGGLGYIFPKSHAGKNNAAFVRLKILNVQVALLPKYEYPSLFLLRFPDVQRLFNRIGEGFDILKTTLNADEKSSGTKTCVVILILLWGAARCLNALTCPH